MEVYVAAGAEWMLQPAASMKQIIMVHWVHMAGTKDQAARLPPADRLKMSMAETSS